MILPTIRASLGRRDALHLVDILAGHDEELREAARRRLDEEGLDALLDDPRVRTALLTDPGVKAPPALVFYVLVRQALLEGGIDSVAAADYVASLMLRFGQDRRAYRVSERSDDEYRYLVDMVQRLGSSTPGEAFLLRTHLGNFSLWLTGLFPDFVESRVRRRGAPPLEYYESMGATGYRMAAESPRAAALGVERIFDEVSTHFSGVRIALNRVADRYLWPGAGDPVSRLLREVVATAS